MSLTSNASPHLRVLDWPSPEQTSFEWPDPWPRSDPSSSYPSFATPSDNPSSSDMAFAFSSEAYYFSGISPDSTTSSEPTSTENQIQTSDHHETASRAKRRKVQNREAQRKCRDRRREQVLNLGERLRNSMAENKNLQVQSVKLQKECERLKSENDVYLKLLQSFWFSDRAMNRAVDSGREDELWSWGSAKGYS